ncbi:MAG: polysaccharide biosynthesis/export family protein [Pseudomonadota bacterium]
MKTGGVFGNAGTDLNVSVVPMTFESTTAANLTTYVPARLPLGFQPEAVQRLTAKSVATPRLTPPPPPPSRPGPRPGFIPDNLPPLGVPEPYLIGIADVLLLSFDSTAATLEQLSGLITAQSKRQGFVVQDDGAIAIPTAGRVRVAGLTLQDAEAMIFQALVNANIDPTFSLEIAEFNSQRVSVGGSVRAPALVPVTLKPLYLHEAVSAAGGLAIADPDVAKIQLFRGGSTYQISANRFLSDPGMRQILLRDGDSVFVASEFDEERARARFEEQLSIRREVQTQAQVEAQIAATAATREQNEIRKLDAERQLFLDRLELGAVKRDYAYLAGEVVKPARFELPFETKAVLADVLLNDRGLNIQYADYGEIYVLRRSTNPEEASSVAAYHLDASNAANLALASMFEIHAGDVVFVAEQPITSWNRALSQALPNLLLSAANVATNF